MKYDAYATNVVNFDFRNHSIIGSMAIALKEFEQEQLHSLRQTYSSLCFDHDDLLRWGLTLTSEQQRQVFGADELGELSYLSRTAMTSAQVRQVLGCTYHELNRWDADGSLEHTFLETVPTIRKDDQIRLWLRRDVFEFKNILCDKRASDSIKKRFGSMTNPLHLIQVASA
ncbi:hypothetical protein [Pseudomonas putida]|uniref:Uncharacterized protein n=1 Tax=Pseudomonas putida TaxID=303 RepID=A0A8I1EDE9_PSEPU|nr:hypothetical protein [Pseudomonas putida]MBI6883228.1 hypothetical protein [Pseudomonas putida]